MFGYGRVLIYIIQNVHLRIYIDWTVKINNFNLQLEQIENNIGTKKNKKIKKKGARFLMLFIIILFYDIFNILLIRIIVVSSHVDSFYRTHLNMDLVFFFFFKFTCSSKI
jgi:hypothetical protein